jgi:hypothetical protein
MSVKPYPPASSLACTLFAVLSNDGRIAGQRRTKWSSPLPVALPAKGNTRGQRPQHKSRGKRFCSQHERWSPSHAHTASVLVPLNVAGNPRDRSGSLPDGEPASGGYDPIDTEGQEWSTHPPGTPSTKANRAGRTTTCFDIPSNTVSTCRAGTSATSRTSSSRRAKASRSGSSFAATRASSSCQCVRSATSHREPNADPRRPAPGCPAPLPGTAPEGDCAAAVARP